MIHSLKRTISAIVGIPGQLELIREAVASYDPDLSKRQAENWHANYLHTKSRFRRALSNLGVAQDAIERFVAGTDIESDHITNHEADLRRQLAESKAAHEYWHDNYVEKVGQLEKQLSAAQSDLDALTRWHKQREKPCPDFGTTWVLASPFVDVQGHHRIWSDIPNDWYWSHTPESLAAWKAQQKAVGDDSQV